MAEPDRVRLRIRGEQRTADGKTEHTEMQAVARHVLKGGRHYLRYEDQSLIEGQTVSSLLKISSDRLQLVRHGAIEQQMEFVCGARREGIFRLPGGSLSLAVRTQELRADCQADGRGRVELRYELFLQEELQSRCRLTIEIEAE